MSVAVPIQVEVTEKVLGSARKEILGGHAMDTLHGGAFSLDGRGCR